MTTEERREKTRQYYQEHAEEIKKKARQYYQEHAEEIKKKALQYYYDHQEECKERCREKKKNDPEYKDRARQCNKRYNKKHRQERNEYSLKWKADHPEHVNRHRQHIHDRYHNDPAYRGSRLFYRYKRLDIKKNVAPADPSEYPTLEEVNEMLLQPCVFCNESDWHKIGLDRKDNRFGHIRGNIQPCCKRCNDKKGKRSNEEFRQAIADGRIKLKTVKTVKAETCDPAVPAMPNMRSLLSE
jgi:hypothetical protein